MAVLMKEDWLEGMVVEAECPVHGVPYTINCLVYT